MLHCPTILGCKENPRYVLKKNESVRNIYSFIHHQMLMYHHRCTAYTVHSTETLLFTIYCTFASSICVLSLLALSLSHLSLLQCLKALY